MHRVIKSSWLVVVAAVLGGFFFWFRPGGVDGARPAPIAATGKGFAHTAFTPVLAAAVGPDGLVDYAALQEDPGPLDAYLGQLRATSPKNAPHRFKGADDRLAYYLNAYNAFMLSAVRDHCPIDNVEAEYFGGGMFWRLSFLMGEEAVTLSMIESEMIPAVSNNDPAVHFALVKGAKGFPALRSAAFTAAGVREELAALTKAVLSNPQYVLREGDTLKLSTLFQWYETDFAGDLEKWLKSQDAQLMVGDPTLKYRPFDWSLNGRCQ